MHGYLKWALLIVALIDVGSPIWFAICVNNASAGEIGVVAPQAGSESSIDETPPNDSLTLDTIIRSMQTWQSKLQALAIVYAFQEGFQRSAYYLDSPSLERVILQDYRFANGRTQFFSSTCSIGLTLCTDVGPITYLDDQVYVKWWSRARLAQEISVPLVLASGNYFQSDCEWLQAVAFWPDKERPPRVNDFFLPEALMSNPYIVLTEREEIDGVSCVVVQREDIDRVWLDPLLGYVPRRRQWRPRVGKALIRRAHDFELWDFRELLDDVWMPWMTRREMLTETTEGSLTTVSVAHTIVGSIRTDIKVNCPEYLPGTIVSTEEGTDVPRTRVLPGGEELLDEVASRIRCDPLATPEGESVTLFACSAAVIFVILLGCVARVRRRSASCYGCVGNGPE